MVWIIPYSKGFQANSKGSLLLPLDCVSRLQGADFVTRSVFAELAIAVTLAADVDSDTVAGDDIQRVLVQLAFDKANIETGDVCRLENIDLAGGKGDTHFTILVLCGFGFVGFYCNPGLSRPGSFRFRSIPSRNGMP